MITRENGIIQMKGMAFREVEVDQIETFINDPAVCFEQKADGTRCLLHIITRPDGTITTHFMARNGQPLKHTAAMQHFESIAADIRADPIYETETILDGELMIDTGKFYAFDMPYFRFGGRVGVEPEMTYNQRRLLMEQGIVDLPGGIGTGAIDYLKSARTPEEKRALLERVRDGGGEGIMIKTLDSPYEPGMRVKHSVKAKFVKTADVVVTKSTRGRNEAGRETGAFSFGVYTEWAEDSEGTNRLGFKNLGACSAIGKPETKEGDVIEVAYLYRGEGGGLVQPRMIRLRPDKTPTDCTLDQFPTYSKGIYA